MEYCKHGDLFDLIKRSGQLSESLAKYLFTQILNGVEYLHSKEGIAHLDLKLENILIGDNLQLKLCDFGFYEELKTRVCKNRGTHGYRAPETYFESNEGYDGAKADIFSLGVILFILNFGVPPFCLATKDDPLYRLFYRGANSSKYFLRLHHSTKLRYATGDLDLELIDLLFQMLDENPLNRPKDIYEVRQHNYFNKGLIPHEEAQS